jgi:hypothetical protein
VEKSWNKWSLKLLIFEIIGIGKEVLQDADKMHGLSVAQRMAWVSKRKITRVEDIAYCLLGIFGVSMPMLYGEGENTFIRLQEEIVKNTNDHTIFAWTSDSYFSNGLLAPKPAFFNDSGNIVQSKNLSAGPFFLTNKGVNLNLPLKTWEKSKLCLAVLNCQNGSGMKRLGIYLERGSEAADVFKRVWSIELGDIDSVDIAELKYENVYIKQERPFISSSTFFRTGNPINFFLYGDLD